MPEFFKGIGCIGNQFANKDFLVCIKGVNDDIQQLLNFCLEFMFSGADALIFKSEY